MRTEAEIYETAPEDHTFSNHTEYEIWADRWCHRCAHDDFETEKYCPILSVSLLGRWPLEWTRERHDWQIGEATGSYETVGDCTEFEERHDNGDDEPKPPEPSPDCDGQLDLIDVYLDTAISELTKEPVTA